MGTLKMGQEGIKFLTSHSMTQSLPHVKANWVLNTECGGTFSQQQAFISMHYSGNGLTSQAAFWVRGHLCSTWHPLTKSLQSVCHLHTHTCMCTHTHTHNLGTPYCSRCTNCSWTRLFRQHHALYVIETISPDFLLAIFWYRRVNKVALKREVGVTNDFSTWQVPFPILTYQQ